LTGTPWSRNAADQATGFGPQEEMMAGPSIVAWQGTDTYIADDSLKATVNAAIALRRPLLVKGEPGTGKTLLAHAVAEGLAVPIHTWHVKSTTRATEGLYVYDAVARLHDSRFGDRDVRDIEQYIELGPLGRSFAAEAVSVVLIDEVDKADIEFPNDLLHELDAMRFTIAETGREVAAVNRPIVIITSNAEKELPDAFLRRCVFHYIDFPDEHLLTEICRVHHPDVDDVLLAEALRRFLELRSIKDLKKKPSTSELIDWLAALRLSGIDPDKLASSLPFAGVLLKDEADTRRVDEGDDDPHASVRRSRWG
jgi:MoxR-like ATPase